MAALLPSLSSDDEEPTLTAAADYSDEESDDGVEVNEGFVFGGALGEDGGLPSDSSMIFLGQEQRGWSYQTALDNLEGGASSSTSKAPPRVEVASLISAKRKILKRDENNRNKRMKAKRAGTFCNADDQTDTEMDAEEVEKDTSDGGKTASNAEARMHCNSSGDNQSSVNESSTDSDSDSDDNNDDDEVDDADREMEHDVLKTRMGGEEEVTGSSVPNINGTAVYHENDSDNDNGHADKDPHIDDDDDEEDDEDREEARKAAIFFERQDQTPPNSNNDVQVFAQLTLSRPLLRGVASMGYVKPTPIQSSVIPVALAGRDICASAVTGSGKTAAFLLPILEKLLYRAPGRIRALILTPTRELAAQCLGMMSTLGQFTKIHSALVVGGSKNLQSQTAELRAGPQLVVATPGRLLDHVTNSTGVSLEDVEFLILDEADRLLDLGFQDEVNELIRACPRQRQTLLFSATMNTKVDDLISLSLKRPVRIRISEKDLLKSNKDLEVAPRLQQEFVRVRAGNEGVNREGMLLALLTRTFSTQTIVFFDTKAKAHRLMILCGLCGIKCSELHGNLTQAQRLQALEQFRTGEVDILLATDLAARGLDISRVETVVNFEMPTQVETYIHRIGRTARAGRGGRSCTLIGEGRRHLMKQIMKDAADKRKVNNMTGRNKMTVQKVSLVRSRSIPPTVISHFVSKIQSLEPHVEEVLQAEAVARMDRLAEMEARKAQNIIEHSDEIKSRPQRQWFASEREKKVSRDIAAETTRTIEEKAGSGSHRMTRKKRRAREAIQMIEEMANQAASDDDGDDDGGNSLPTNRQASTISEKRAAREKKRQIGERQKAKFDRSVHDDHTEYVAKQRKKHKGAMGTDALGDSSLFSEEKVSYAEKSKNGPAEERVQSIYNFRGYDPSKDGRKKVKKRGVNKFKSKSKYKRRR